jgi:hypothetical protein
MSNLWARLIGVWLGLTSGRLWPIPAAQVLEWREAATDPKRTVEKRGATVLSRKCPNCSTESISVTGLILSDVVCTNCGQLVGVHWLFRSVFFVIILAATILTAIVVLIYQGLYATLLMISVPIGAIGFIKAHFCPLVLKQPKPESQDSSSELGRPLTRD